MYHIDPDGKAVSISAGSTQKRWPFSDSPPQKRWPFNDNPVKFSDRNVHKRWPFNDNPVKFSDKNVHKRWPFSDSPPQKRWPFSDSPPQKRWPFNDSPPQKRWPNSYNLTQLNDKTLRMEQQVIAKPTPKIGRQNDDSKEKGRTEDNGFNLYSTSSGEFNQILKEEVFIYFV